MEYNHHVLRVFNRRINHFILLMGHVPQCPGCYFQTAPVTTKVVLDREEITDINSWFSTPYEADNIYPNVGSHALVSFEYNEILDLLEYPRDKFPELYPPVYQ